MSTWRRTVTAGLVGGWLVLTQVGAAVAAEPSASPSPGPSPSPGRLSAEIIAANLEIGKLFAWVGLAMLITTFLGMAVLAVFSAYTQWRKPKIRAATGGFPLGAIVAAILKAMPEFVKTPGGIGALLAILGVVQLLGIAAIETGQLSDEPLVIEASPSPNATEAPSPPAGTSAPTDSPQPEPSPS